MTYFDYAKWFIRQTQPTQLAIMHYLKADNALAFLLISHFIKQLDNNVLQDLVKYSDTNTDLHKNFNYTNAFIAVVKQFMKFDNSIKCNSNIKDYTVTPAVIVNENAARDLPIFKD